MFILAIDTTTIIGSVAVLEGEKTLVENVYQARSGHAEGLVLAVDSVLMSTKLDISDINLFAVAIGPGSFTGLRVGLATAKGLAIGANKPIIGISSLEALSGVAPFRVRHESIIPCLDAHRNEVYASVNGHEASFTPESLCDELLKHEDKYLFIGDGAFRYKENFEKRLGDNFQLVSENETIPLAASTGKLAFAKFNKGQTSDLANLIPNYIRKPDAELKLKA